MSRVRVLVVTHGHSGAEMVSTMQALLGGADPTVIEDFASVDVPVRADRAEVERQVDEAVRLLDAGAGVLVALDLLGSTPYNAVTAVARGRAVATVCGVNLPMIMKLATTDREGQSPAEVGKLGADTAVRSIKVVPPKVNDNE